MSLLTPEKIAELKTKHGDLRKVTIGEEVFVFRAPSRAEWQRFEQDRAEEAKRMTARENLLRYCIVYPDTAGLEAALDRKPGLIVPMTEKAAELAGLAEKVHDEKL